MFLIERNQIIVGGFEEEPVAVNADASISDVDAALGLPPVMPKLAAGAGVHGPGVIGNGEIQHAVHFERRRL